MEENSKEQKKLSYEELENVAVQLQRRCVELERRLRDFSIASFRLEYLFKVIENKDNFSSDFIGDCVKEVEDILTIKDTNTKE